MRAYVALIAIAVAAVACDRADEGRAVAPTADRGAKRLAVVTRLLDLVERREGPIVGNRCPIDDERRPALGCSQWKVVAERTFAPDAAAPPLSVALPRTLAAPTQPHIVEWSVQGPGETVAVRRPPTVHAATPPFLQADLADVAGADATPGTRLTLRSRQTLPERIRTMPVDVPPGSALEFGLAIDGTMPHADVEAVIFGLSAETAAGERPLFEWRLAPTDPAAGRWTDHRVALDDVVGPQVRFVFTTRLVPRPGAESVVGALPLWGAPEILAPSDEPAPDVILISFDTLRADHVGAYGSELPTTPHLDRLAAEGIVVDDVFATYPATSASHMSMMTGTYPVTHGVLVGEPLRKNVPTLATLLGARGWRTGAVTENGMLRADSGFSSGVSFYREHKQVEPVGIESRMAGATFDAATRWITEHADERYFLFIHTYVVHWPYEPPAEYDVFKASAVAAAAAPVARAPRDIDAMRRSYAGEARYGDALFGELRATLARLGLANDTLIVVTSDHGEEFGEHGGWSHAQTLYDEVLRIPLILWAPRHLGTPRRIPGLASLVDVAPTILDVLDVPPPPRVDGRSLLEAPPDAERVVFAELFLKGERRVMARNRDAKWVWDYGDRRVLAAFDLRSDPRERTSIAESAFHARGATFLADYLARAPVVRQPPAAVPVGATAPPPASDQPADPAIQEKLRALGYVE